MKPYHFTWIVLGLITQCLVIIGSASRGYQNATDRIYADVCESRCNEGVEIAQQQSQPKVVNFTINDTIKRVCLCGPRSFGEIILK